MKFENERNTVKRNRLSACGKPQSIRLIIRFLFNYHLTIGAK